MRGTLGGKASGVRDRRRVCAMGGDSGELGVQEKKGEGKKNV
jgi:hypothetical protein